MFYSMTATSTMNSLSFVPRFLRGTDSGETLKGRDGNDTIYAGKGTDIVDAGGGDDFISAGSASDYGTSYGYYGNDTVRGGDGTDTIDYSRNLSDFSRLEGEGGTDYIFGGFGIDVIYGGDEWDYIDGGNGNDVIQGEAGDDYIWGGEGDDLIVGGSGVDTLTGGSGADTFIFGWGDAPLAPETIPGTYPTYQERTDCITDWSFEDTISFRDGPSGSYDNFVKSHASGYDNAFWAAENYYIGGDKRYAFVADTGDKYGWLFADQDGNGSIDAAVMIEGANSDNFNWWDIQ